MPGEIRMGLASALRTIPGLTVSEYRPANLTIPHAVVSLSSWTYDATMGRGSDTVSAQVVIYMGRADEQLSVQNLDVVLAGHGGRSLKTILEDTDLTGLTAAMVRVRSGQTGFASSADGSELAAATFDVDVVVSGLT